MPIEAARRGYSPPRPTHDQTGRDHRPYHFGSIMWINQPHLPLSHQLPVSWHNNPTALTHPTMTTEKDGTHCALCIQALYELRFACMGRVNCKWCKCNHPPLVGRQKVQWSEAEVKHRRELLNARQGTGQKIYIYNGGSVHRTE